MSTLLLRSASLNTYRQKTENSLQNSYQVLSELRDPKTGKIPELDSIIRRLSSQIQLEKNFGTSKDKLFFVLKSLSAVANNAPNANSIWEKAINALVDLLLSEPIGSSISDTASFLFDKIQHIFREREISETAFLLSNVLKSSGLEITVRYNQRKGLYICLDEIYEALEQVFQSGGIKATLDSCGDVSVTVHEIKGVDACEAYHDI